VVTVAGGGDLSTRTCSAIFEAALMAAGPTHSVSTVIIISSSTFTSQKQHERALKKWKKLAKNLG